MQTNSSGAVSASKQFDAFGNQTGSSGTWKSQFGYAGGFGYQQDSDTGLKLLGHRYYDSDTGRFLTRDSAKDGRNWYSYCASSPVQSADPTGFFLETLADIVGIGVDIADIWHDPTNGWAWGGLAWSVGAIFVPFVPGSWSGRVAKAGTKAVKALAKADNAIDAAKHADDIPGVYLRKEVESGNWYVGQSADIPSRKHGTGRFDDDGEFPYYPMPNSTKKERESFEQYVKDSLEETAPTANERNPIGGRPWLKDLWRENYGHFDP
ncbi:MAG: RHS repeat-associated core domain-containing protein [Fimbriimonadaceae bacterium]|nr:MAG: RHS repeat-associated core domain-containing protein [Fimbriimonadaceae bacterium]